MNLRVVSMAEQELAGAVDYYNQQREGLGFEVAAEVAAAFERIGQYPDAWRHFSATTRRCQVRRFPYGVIYCVHEDEIVIMAIMHLARHPQRGGDGV